MKNKERKNLLVFGYGLAVILTFMTLRFWIKHGFSPFGVIVLLAAALLALITATNVQILKPFYTAWMAVAHRIGGVVSSVILIIIFYTLFGIAGIILRLLGKDLLSQRIEKEAKTYWRKRPSQTEDVSRYTRQY